MLFIWKISIIVVGFWVVMFIGIREMGKIKYGLLMLFVIGFWMDVISVMVLELFVWEWNYIGIIVGKLVNVNIMWFGNMFYGYYCYEFCN